MNIIIIGAGELGRMLAARLSADEHSIAVIDSSRMDFDQLRDKLDVMTIGAEGTDISALKRAGIKEADLLIAASGNQDANILACQIAGHFKVPKSICRLYSHSAFSPDDGVTPESFGLDRTFSSPDECALHVMDVLKQPLVLERIHFSNPNATMVTISVTTESPLKGLKIKDIPGTDIMNNIRVATMVRRNKLMVPHGDTELHEGDLLYIAGRQDHVDAFLAYAAGDAQKPSSPLIVIAGANLLSAIIARRCLECGMRVRLIDESQERCEILLSHLNQGIMAVKGSSNDSEVLEEAGADQCDAFVSALDDDENNILGCILAKRMGAKKVITVTHKPEYLDIVPAMDAIDCGFNSTLVSVNAVFRLMEEGIIRIDSRLKMFNAYLTEFHIAEKSRLCGKQIKECQLPRSIVLAMLIRGEEVIAPSGNTHLRSGDTVIAILTPSAEEELKAFL